MDMVANKNRVQLKSFSSSQAVHKKIVEDESSYGIAMPKESKRASSKILGRFVI
jgi:hypothetical protein